MAKKIELMKIIKEIVEEVVGEVRDDGKFDAAETVEVIGQLTNKLDDAGLLPRPGDALIAVAVKMGEDGI